MLSGGSLGAAYYRGRDIFYIGISGTWNFHKTHRFAWSEIGRLRWRRQLQDPFGWRPALDLGCAYSSLTSSKPERRFDDRGFGAVAGLVLLGQTESLAYAYNTALGGYHSVSLEIYTRSAGTLKAGTRIEYRFHREAELLLLSLFLEGGGTEKSRP